MSKISSNYEAYFKEYLDIFEPLFQKALEVSEINLILTLLAFRGAHDEGWNPYENTKEVALDIYKNSKKFPRNLQLNMHLWMYAHFVESSEQYETIANLVKTTKGEDYVIANHKNKNFVNLKVEQKILRLTKIAKDTDFENVVEPFKRTFDAKFRNAIAHADYSIKSTGSQGITVVSDKDDDYPEIYDLQRINDLINRSLALHTSIRTLIETYIAHYSEPQTVKSSISLSGGEIKNVDLIIRKGHGVIGISFIGGYDFGTDPFTTRLVSCLPYEKKYIDRGDLYLPASRIDKVNRVLNIIPPSLRRKILPIIENKYVNR